MLIFVLEDDHQGLAGYSMVDLIRVESNLISFVLIVLSQAKHLYSQFALGLSRPGE